MLLFCNITKCKLLTLLAFSIVIAGIAVDRCRISVATLIEKEKCPFCYGLSACPLIDEGFLEVQSTSLLSIFNHLFGIKNIYYGIYGETDVVFKKLAYNSELADFDSKLDEENTLSKVYVEEDICNDVYYTKIVEEVTSDTLDSDNKLRLCPNAKNLNVLLRKVIRKRKLLPTNIWTLIKINPEPLILDILSAEDNWPVPKFFGSCGRLAIVENVGPLLSTYINVPWKLRAKIASSLFDAAEALTFRNADFSFYLTDISMDNIAVDSFHRAKFIDLENIIIVDKNNSKDDAPLRNEIHLTEIHVDCPDCFIFSPADICRHNISDHNYYAICWHILLQGWTKDFQPRGFLHGIPQTVRDKYPNLIELLKQCSTPDSNSARINTGLILAKLLGAISQNEGINE